MDIFTNLLIGIGLSMDCFAVSLAIGTTTRSDLRKTALIIAACFGFFQGGMVIAGWIFGTSLYSIISAYGPWIAFLLLAFIGIKMIREGMSEEKEETLADLKVLPVLILAVATSIDALAVGVSFGVLGEAVLLTALIIGLVCFVFSFSGVIFGMQLEKILGNKTEIAGGAILVLIGLRILAQALFF